MKTFLSNTTSTTRLVSNVDCLYVLYSFLFCLTIKKSHTVLTSLFSSKNVSSELLDIYRNGQSAYKSLITGQIIYRTSLLHMKQVVHSSFTYILGVYMTLILYLCHPCNTSLSFTNRENISSVTLR